MMLCNFELAPGFEMISPLLRKWPLSYSFFKERQRHFLLPLSGRSPVNCLPECGFLSNIVAADNAISSLHHYSSISRSILNQLSRLRNSKASKRLRTLPIAGLGPDGLVIFIALPPCLFRLCACRGIWRGNSVIIFACQSSRGTPEASIAMAVVTRLCFFLRYSNV